MSPYETPGKELSASRSEGSSSVGAPLACRSWTVKILVLLPVLPLAAVVTMPTAKKLAALQALLMVVEETTTGSFCPPTAGAKNALTSE